jgi:chorismate mutase
VAALDEARKKIDEIDVRITELLNDRAREAAVGDEGV